MKCNPNTNLVELIEELEKIKATPENIERNRTTMEDNNGGFVEF
jgi:hypothetical protein